MGKNWTKADIEKLKGRGIRVYDPQLGTGTVVVDQVEATNNQRQSFALGRLKDGEMNKTERLYADHLEMLKRAGEIIWYEFEPMNLRLAAKCYYRVDFMVMRSGGQLECHEVKGFWEDDALVKIKTAAAKFPFRFIAVRHVKGSWEVREF